MKTCTFSKILILLLIGTFGVGCNFRVKPTKTPQIQTPLPNTQPITLLPTSPSSPMLTPAQPITSLPVSPSSPSITPEQAASQTPTPSPTPTFNPTLTSTPTLVPIPRPELVLEQSFPLPEEAFDVAWSKDGQLLAVATEKGIQLYETATWSVVDYHSMGGKVFKLAWTNGMLYEPDTYDGLYAAGDNGLIFWSTSPTNPLKVYSLAKNHLNWCVTVKQDYWSEFTSISSVLDDKRSVLEEFPGGMLPVLTGKPNNNISQLASSGLFTNSVWNKGEEEQASIRGYLANLYELLPKRYLPTDPKAISYSPDGGRLAAGTRLTPFIVQTGFIQNFLYMDMPIHFLQPTELLDLDWSPDGEYLAAGGSTLAIWNSHQGNLVHQLNGHTKYIWSVSYARDGKLLASGSEDGTIRLWDTDQGIEINRIEAHSSGVRGVEWSPAGMRLASVGRDKTLKIWELANYPDWNAPAPVDKVQPVNLSDTQITTENINKITKLMPIHLQDILPKLVSPDGKLLVWIVRYSWEKTAMRVWDLRSGALYEMPEENPISFSPDGRYLITYKFNQGLHYWSWSDQFTLSQSIGIGVRSIPVLSPDGKILAFQENDSVQIWQISNLMWERKLIHTLDKPESAFYLQSIQFSPTGAWVAITYSPGILVLWNWQDGRTAQTLVWENSDNVISTFSPDGRYLAVAIDWSWRKENPPWGIVELWELRDGKYEHNRDIEVSSVMPNVAYPHTLAFSKSGDILAVLVSRGDARTTEFYQVSDSALLYSLSLSDNYSSIQFSPDGSLAILDTAEGGEIWGISP